MTIAQDKLQKVINDQRYTVTAEYTGKQDPQHVLRFDGKFISASSDLNDVIFSAIFHQDERELNLLGA